MPCVVRLLMVVVALVLAGAASADGDPASDVLLARNTFTPYPSPSAAALKELTEAVQAVDLKGDRLKVAVIAAKSDLGSIPSLFGQAQNYAKFLSTELSFIYKGPLLTVMPSGFGFADNQEQIPAADAALTGIAIGDPSADGLTLAAARAVPALERAGVLHYKDTFAPLAYPSPGKVAAGHSHALRYQAWDDSGRAKVDIRIENGQGTTVARFDPPLRAVEQGAWYSVAWLVPRKYAHRVLSFCVQATDPSGNHSRRSCAKLSVT